jgi:hypothetical protein
MICDEKGQASDCGSVDARGIPRLEKRDTGGSPAAQSERPIVLSDSRPPFAKSTRRMGHPLHGCAGGGWAPPIQNWSVGWRSGMTTLILSAILAANFEKSFRADCAAWK